MPRRNAPLPPVLGDAFARADGRAAGVTDRRMRGRDLERPFHGARLRIGAGEEPATDEPQAIDIRKRERVRQRARAYASVMGPHSFFAGMTAAALFGAPLPDGFDPEAYLCVAARHPHRAARAQGTRGMQIRAHLASTTLRSGLPVASPASTWAMLAQDLPPRWLVILGDAFVRVPRDERGRPLPGQQLATPDQLRAAALIPGRRRRAPLLHALTEIRVGSASRLETEYRLDAAHAGLPEMELDVELRDDRGTLLAIADGVHRRYGVVVEIEGDHHRTSRRQWARDIDRIAALTAAGWEVVRLTGLHLRSGAATGIAADALRRHGWAGPASVDKTRMPNRSARGPRPPPTPNSPGLSARRAPDRRRRHGISGTLERCAPGYSASSPSTCSTSWCSC